MGKKSLYVGISLIPLSLFFIIGGLTQLRYNAGGGFLIILIFGLPLLMGAIILLRKYSKSKNLSTNSQNEVEFDTKKQEIVEKEQHPKSGEKTQFWVCPVCNGDFKEVDGKSYCQNCERYF